MDSRDNCAQTEDVLRAIRSSDWDEKKKRWSSNLFTGPDTSVSRLAITERSELVSIFRAELHKPPVHRVIKTGCINVGTLQDIGANFCVNGQPKPKTIDVKVDPVIGAADRIDNPAHAEIPQKLPRSLAFEIIKQLKFEDADTPKRTHFLGLFAGVFRWFKRRPSE